MKRSFFVIAALTFPIIAAAQIQLGGLDRAAEARKQHVVLLTDSLQLTANKPQDVELRFRVEPGFHINSHKPKDELLIPTELKLDSGAFHITNQQYPPGSHFRLQVGNGADLNVYQGEFRVALQIEAPRGDSTLSGSLRYQACDNAACFPARTLPVKIAVSAK